MLVGVVQVGRQRGLARRRAALRGQADVEVPVGEHRRSRVETAGPLEQRPPDHHRGRRADHVHPEQRPLQSLRGRRCGDPAPLERRVGRHQAGIGVVGPRVGAAVELGRILSGPRSRRRRGTRPTLPAPRRCPGSGRLRRRSVSRCGGAARARPSAPRAAPASRQSSPRRRPRPRASRPPGSSTDASARASSAQRFLVGSRPKPGLGADPRRHRSVRVSQGSRFPVARSITAVHPSIGRAAAVWSLHNA